MVNIAPEISHEYYYDGDPWDGDKISVNSRYFSVTTVFDKKLNSEIVPAYTNMQGPSVAEKRYFQEQTKRKDWLISEITEYLNKLK